MSSAAISARLSLCLACCAGAAHALDAESFDTFNKSPLVQIYGLPAGRVTPVLAPGSQETSLAVDLSTNYTVSENAVEGITLDGETYRTTLVYRRGLPGGREWGVHVPYITHRGGFLDNFIIDWHDFFGFPEGGREQAPIGALTYRYTREGVDRVSLDQSAEGVGDVRLTGAETLGDGRRVHVSLKLPTGKAATLTGSGSTDIAVWLTTPHTVGDRGHGLYGALGLLAMTRGDVLPAQQRRLVAFGTAGVAWAALPSVTLKAQIDAHTPFYRDSSLHQLTDASLQLGLGGSVALSRSASLDLAVVEDVIVNTAPDATFHLSLRVRY